MAFFLFVKEKLPFGNDSQKDEWISAQATLMMKNFTPDYKGRDAIESCIMDLVRWRGLCFASTMCVRYDPILSQYALLLTRCDSIMPRFLLEGIEVDVPLGFSLALLKYKDELIGLPVAE